MRKRWLLLIALCFWVAPVKAFYCSYQDLAYYKKLASNINVSYDYQEQDNKVTFSTTILNLQPDLYIIDTTTGNRYDYKEGEIMIEGYRSGQNLQYTVYTNNTDCNDQILATIRLTLPSYNPYYTDEICSGINYNLCDRWSSHGLSYDAFVKRVTEYKKSLIKEEKPKEEEKYIPDNSIVQIIIRFIGKYYYVFLILTILGSSVGIYVINKKDNMYY